MSSSQSRKAVTQMHRLTLLIFASLALGLMTVAPAMATTEHTTQRSATVTGADATAGTLKDVERIELGSATTTVTVAREGASHPIVIDYSAVLSPTGSDGKTNPLMPLLTLSVGAVALRSVIRLFQTLARFQRRS